MSDREETSEEIEKSRNSWRTWGIISIIGAVFCFIVAVLLLIFIFKYRSQLSACKDSISESFGSMRNSIGERFTSLGDRIKVSGGCGACAVGGCDCTKGGCGCDISGGAANSSSFLNSLLKK